MEEQLERVIRILIFKKYPYLYEVEVKDPFLGISSMSTFYGSSYHCYFKTEECLSTKKQMEIDKEVKLIFFLLAPPNNKFNLTPKVSCFFDCGNGYEFSMEPGYSHL